MSKKHPIYLQVKESILNDIQRGVYLPGSCLPSEHDFCEEFSASRMTIRHAIDELCYEGVLYRVHGKGTFVMAEKFFKSMSTLQGNSYDIRQWGMEPSCKLLQIRELKADRSLATSFQTTIGTPLILIVRLRYADGTPLTIEKAYYPAAECAFLKDYDLENNSIYTILREHGIKLHRANQYIEAVALSKEEAQTLEVDIHAPSLLVVRQSFNSAGKVIEYVKCIYNGSRVRFCTELYGE